MPKTKKDDDRTYLSKCVGKIMAYHLLGNTVQAKEWAKNLVTKLQQMGLYPAGG